MSRIRALIAKRRTEPDLHVHFHRGPQGQPVPCFDEHCPRPSLSM